MSRTHHAETDTTVEEREILLQRAGEAVTLGHRDKIQAVRDQLREHREMYQADAGLTAVDEQLRRLDAALGEESPDSYRYAENDPQ